MKYIDKSKTARIAKFRDSVAYCSAHLDGTANFQFIPTGEWVTDNCGNFIKNVCAGDDSYKACRSFDRPRSIGSVLEAA